MSAQVLHFPVPTTATKRLQLHHGDAWHATTDACRKLAAARQQFILPILNAIHGGLSLNKSIERALSAVSAGHNARLACFVAAGNKPMPSRATVAGWIKLYRTRGNTGLLPKHRGRCVQVHAWHALAIELYNKPSNPSMAAVQRQLHEIHGYACSVDQVVAYLNALPASLGKKGRARLGNKTFGLTQNPYVIRHTRDLAAGDMWMADGYTIDEYLLHPRNARLWRPELTVWMDVKSRVVVGWRLGEAECCYDVQAAFIKAVATTNHVPVGIYIDNGSGFVAKQLLDAATGLYARAGIEQVYRARPGNPKAKGQVERFFGIVKDDFLKTTAGLAFAGKDMAADAKREFNIQYYKISKRGDQLPAKYTPRTIQQWSTSFNEWLLRYSLRENPEYQGHSRWDVWSKLKPRPPIDTTITLARPRQECKVVRGMIRSGKLRYSHPSLYEFNGRKILLDYDLHDNSFAVARTSSGKLIAQLHVVSENPFVEPSRFEKNKISQQRQRLTRLEQKIAEEKQKSGVQIEAQQYQPIPAIATTNPIIFDIYGDDDA